MIELSTLIRTITMTIISCKAFVSTLLLYFLQKERTMHFLAKLSVGYIIVKLTVTSHIGILTLILEEALIMKVTVKWGRSHSGSESDSDRRSFSITSRIRNSSKVSPDRQVLL